MKTHTMGCTPLSVIEECLPHKYSMELNKTDMMALLECLNNYIQCAEPDGESPSNIDWAIQFRSGILYTIGIEEV